MATQLAGSSSGVGSERSSRWAIEAFLLAVFFMQKAVSRHCMSFLAVPSLLPLLLSFLFFTLTCACAQFKTEASSFFFFFFKQRQLSFRPQLFSPFCARASVEEADVLSFTLYLLSTNEISISVAARCFDESSPLTSVTTSSSFFFIGKHHLHQIPNSSVRDTQGEPYPCAVTRRAPRICLSLALLHQTCPARRWQTHLSLDTLYQRSLRTSQAEAREEFNLQQRIQSPRGG